MIHNEITTLEHQRKTQCSCPRSHQIFPSSSNHEIVRDYVHDYLDVGPPLFTLLQPEMLMDVVETGRCDQPLKSGEWVGNIVIVSWNKVR